MNKTRLGLGSESGQGIIEYILLLVVVITLAFMLMNRFSKPFGQWAQFYIGDYVECLLDQGELPNVDGEGTVQDCISPFDFPQGEEASKTAEKNGGGDKNAKPAEQTSTSHRGPHDSSASGSRVLQSRNGGSFKRFTIGMDGSSSESKSTIATAETKAEKNREFRVTRIDTGMRTSQGNVTRIMGLSGLMASEKEKIKKREQKVQKIAVASEEGEATHGTKKFEVKPPSRKLAEVDISGGDWSLGKLLRILLIVVIAIALALFIGGQMVQMSKSLEK